jgi:hypothetical protein
VRNIPEWEYSWGGILGIAGWRWETKIIREWREFSRIYLETVMDLMDLMDEGARNGRGNKQNGGDQGDRRRG